MREQLEDLKQGLGQADVLEELQERSPLHFLGVTACTFE